MSLPPGCALQLKQTQNDPPIWTIHVSTPAGVEDMGTVQQLPRHKWLVKTVEQDIGGTTLPACESTFEAPTLAEVERQLRLRISAVNSKGGGILSHDTAAAYTRATIYGINLLASNTGSWGGFVTGVGQSLGDMLLEDVEPEDQERFWKQLREVAEDYRNERVREKAARELADFVIGKFAAIIDGAQGRAETPEDNSKH